MLTTLRTLFPRPIRAAIYAAGIAADAALIGTGNLPGWSAAVAAPLLLALLHLTPADVTSGSNTVKVHIDSEAVLRAIRKGNKPIDPAPGQD